MTSNIIQGDARHIPLADNSVDLVITSPPYEDARTYGIDFRRAGHEWVEWATDCFCECLRVCKGLVAWVVEGRTTNYEWSGSPIRLAARLQDMGIPLRKPPIYQRVGIPGSGGPDWWRNDYEFIICATRGSGRLPWSDNTATGHPPKWAPGGEMSHRLTNGERRNQWGGSAFRSTNTRRANGTREIRGPSPSHRVFFRGAADGTVKGSHVRDICARANPGNVIRCKVGGGHMGHALAHENEAPFPESLVTPFVRCYCPPEGIVLDPFSGSGTTAAVAAKWGRRAIAMDLRPSQTQLTQRRLQLAVPTLFQKVTNQ